MIRHRQQQQFDTEQQNTPKTLLRVHPTAQHLLEPYLAMVWTEDASCSIRGYDRENMLQNPPVRTLPSFVRRMYSLSTRNTARGSEYSPLSNTDCDIFVKQQQNTKTKTHTHIPGDRQKQQQKAFECVCENREKTCGIGVCDQGLGGGGGGYADVLYDMVIVL